MRIIRLVSVFLLLFAFVSCASKQLPKPTGPDVGLLIVPVEGIRQVSGKFVYRYQFDFNEIDKVVIKVGSGKSFATKVLKAGNYIFNSMKIFGVNQGRTTATSKPSVHDLENDFTFEIKPGEVTYFPFGVGAVIKKAGLRSYTQVPNYFKLTEDVLDEYGELVSKAENAALWQQP